MVDGEQIIAREAGKNPKLYLKIGTKLYFSEFIEVFGGTVPGLQANADPWREGNLSSPMYATYAAQAWLRNNSPITVTWTIEPLVLEKAEETTYWVIQG